MGAFTVRVSDETSKRLDRLAEKLDRSRANVAARAIEEFVEREAWQLAEIEAGLREAEAGDFASPKQIAAILSRYSASGRKK